MPDDLRAPKFDNDTDREAATIRLLSFRLRRWQNQPALASKDRRQFRPFDPAEHYDPDRWEVVPDAWDHEHCGV